MNKIKMAKIVLMCLILTLSLSGCNSDNAPDVIDITDKVGEIHYLNSLSDNFNDFPYTKALRLDKFYESDKQQAKQLKKLCPSCKILVFNHTK